MDKRDLKDYIVKLNDRNIQRQRETGFTLYAILGVIVFCIFYIIDNIEILTTIFNDYKYLNVAVFVSNALFIFSLFYLSYETATRRQSLTKIFPYQQPLNIEISDFPFIISYLSICILNLRLVGQHQNIHHKIFLLIIIVLLALNVLSPFLIKIYSQYKKHKRKKKGQSIEEFDFTFFNKKVIRLFSISFLIYATILSFYWIIVALTIDFALEPKIVAEISRFVLILFSFMYLVKKMMDIKSKQRDNNQLEDFEKEIFFENISNEEIAKKYEKEFDGIPFSKWITEKQIETMNFFDQKRQLFLAQDILIFDIDSIDKNQLPYEFTGRLQDVINNQVTILTETTDFVQKISGAFSNLKNFSSLNEEEVEKLNYVHRYLNQLIMAFNSQYSSLSNKVEIRQNKKNDITNTANNV